jgi:single-strand DNA-binding protein
MSLPQVYLVGNAVADAEIRFTNDGKPIAKFRVACSTRIKGEDGEWRDGESTFISVTVFGGIAESVAESVTKGAKVAVSGRLKQRQWEAQDGSKRTDYEITADEVSLGLKPPRKQAGQQSGAPSWDNESPSWGPGTSPQADEPPF